MAHIFTDTNNLLIYVVDDESAIARLVSINLATRGYHVKEFDTGSAAIAQLGIDDPDLVILDIMMPGPDGLETTRQIRQFSQVPILILSVRGDTASKLTAPDLGADDYLTKPFEIEELLARVRAILRRTTPSAGKKPIRSVWNYRSGGLYVDLDGFRIVSHDRSLKLTPREWAILRVFVKYAGRVVTPRTLLQEVWGPEFGDEVDYVRTYVSRLRRQREPERQQPRYLLLEHGLGYRLVEED